MTAAPTLPPLGDDVRLATTKDLTRIATVAAAGFYFSPVFQFQRPYFAEFPEDTLASYFSEYQAAIQDPGSVVIVTEDTLSERDSDAAYEALRKVPWTRARPDANGKVIAGVCSITLNSASGRVGQFQPGHADAQVRDLGLKKQQRDQHRGAAEVYDRLSGPAKAKHLAGRMRLSTLAVHPAYWRRGHASRLVNWCIRLADLEGVPVGVSAAPTGVAIVKKASFEEQERVWVDGYAVRLRSDCTDDEKEHSIPGLELWIGIRNPTRLSGGPTVQPLPFWSPRPWLCQTENLSL